MKAGLGRNCAYIFALIQLAYLATPAFGQDAATAAPMATADDNNPDSTLEVDAAPFVPAGTIVDILLDEPVGSKTHAKGDWFALSLAEPVMLGDAIVLPAGTKGRGQVVHSAKAGWGGKGGELILAARYLEIDGRRIALRGLKLGARGKGNETIAMATVMAIGPVGMLINGKNAALPDGTPATAKLAEDLSPPPTADDDGTMETIPADQFESGTLIGADNREGIGK